MVAASTALALSQGLQAQQSGTVATIGGTGEPGYQEGIHGISEFRSPSALALRGEDFLFIADTDNNAVRSLRLSDTKVTTFASNYVNRPVGLAFDNRTNLFVANQGDGTVTKFDYFGNFRATLRPALMGGPITALAIDRDDHLYLAERDGVVIRIDGAGAIDTVLRPPAGGAREFRGVAVTADGTVYVSDAAAQVIWRFRDGVGEVFAGTLNSSGSTQGEIGFGRLNRPHQIAVGPNNSLVVADRGNHQVRAVSCAGIITTIYGIDPSQWFVLPGHPEVLPGWWDSTAEFAELREPVGIAVTTAGTVYDSEVYYHLIRKADAVQLPLPCGGTTGGPVSTNAIPGPVLTPNSGYYPNGVVLVVSSGSSSGFSRDTRLFYTMDGTEPDMTDTEIPIGPDGKGSKQLDGPIDLAKLRVRAFVGVVGGETTQALPTVVPVPILSPNSGYFPMGATISVTSTNGFPEGTVLYYTTDGTVPTTNSPSISNDGTSATINWRDARRDLRSLRVKAVLGPNQGTVVTGRAVSFPADPGVDGEIGVPPGRSGYNAGIGSFYVLPIIANLREGQKLQSLQFVVELSPLPGSPRLERSDLRVLPMSTNDFIPVLPASSSLPYVISVARDGTNTFAITYSGTNTGFNISDGYATVALLGIQFRAVDSAGVTAEIGDGYNLRILRITGTSDGGQGLIGLKAMPDRTIRFQNVRFREGDTSPAYWYNAGDFGNDYLENGDVNNSIFAAFGFGRPYQMTDAFAAMDVYRLGVLENVVEYNDAANILRRALGFESENVFRVRNDLGEWESSASTAQLALKRQTIRSLAIDTRVWSRDVTIVGGVLDKVSANQAIELPVYMKAGTGVTVAGLQFVANVLPRNGAPMVSGVDFVPSSEIPSPTRFGSSVPGLGLLPSTVYARWDNLDPGLKGTVLLGYIKFKTPSGVLEGQHYDILFGETGGASIDWTTGSLTAYFFEGTHGEVWPLIAHPEVPQVSDDWKVHFFGTVDTAGANSDEDADGDGFTNAEEYVVGTNPTSRDWQVKKENGQVSFRWVGRTGKSYSVESAQDLKNWNAVTGKITGQDTFLEYNEPINGAKAQFFRLNVQ